MIKFLMNFWNFSIKYTSIPIFAAMYAVNVTSPAQLPLVSGCRNSGETDPKTNRHCDSMKALTQRADALKKTWQTRFPKWRLDVPNWKYTLYKQMWTYKDCHRVSQICPSTQLEALKAPRWKIWVPDLKDICPWVNIWNQHWKIQAWNHG